MEPEVGLYSDVGRGPSIVLRSGKRFHVLDPRPDDIKIADIAASLSKLCRYTGHCKQFYSVAEHCYLVSVILEKELGRPEAAMWGLLHDAQEAYIGDMSRPLKVALRQAGITLYDDTADKLDAAVAEAFGITVTEDMAAAVKFADNIALATEKAALIDSDEEWLDLPNPSVLFDIPHSPWPAPWAEYQYLERFMYLELKGKADENA